MATVSAPLLDLSQRAAVEVDVSVRQVVIAGPGSGKTEVVSALVEHLVVEEQVDPEISLLVLSFSRAAVHAVTRRLRAADVQAVAAVRTIDSLAQRIVREAYGEEIAGRNVFDRRIARATQALQAGAWDRVRELEHVVVDEVQDVVGLRAEFVSALLAALGDGAGFTLLGDPAQAIYDFQLTPEHPTTSGELVARVEAMPGVQQRVLLGSYRAGTRDAAAAVALRELGDPSLNGAEDDICDFLLGVTPVDDEGIRELARHQGGGLVVLTATNGQALMEAEDLWKQGVPVQVRRPLTAPVTDAWVADVLGRAGSWDLASLTEAMGDAGIAVERWRGVRGWGRPGSRAVETREVARRLRSGFVPAELQPKDPDVPVVSTVHRSKGLEYDTVVFAQYDDRRDTDEDPAQMARVQYVALTRARFRLLRIERNRYPHLVRRDERTGRWLRCWQRRGSVKAVEIRGDDLERTRPPGEDVARAQAHLRSRVRPGDPVTLVHDWTSVDTHFWDVKHEGVTIGRTTAAFGEQLRSLLGGNLALDLRGVHVECVETVAGDPVDDAAGGIGKYGMWLGVRLVGLAVREWKDEL